MKSWNNLARQAAIKNYGFRIMNERFLFTAILDDELDFVYPGSCIQYRVSLTSDDKKPSFFAKKTTNC